jgi:hypothetical protein
MSTRSIDSISITSSAGSHAPSHRSSTDNRFSMPPGAGPITGHHFFSGPGTGRSSLEGIGSQVHKVALDTPLIRHGEGIKLSLSGHALHKSFADHRIFRQHERRLNTYHTSEEVQFECERVLDQFLSAPLEDQDSDVRRSAQKQTLKLLDTHFARQPAPEQQALFSTFVNRHMEHLLFHKTTERCAILRGLETVASMLNNMHDQGNGRVTAAAEFLQKVCALNNEAHKGIANGIKGASIRLAARIFAAATAPTLVLPAIAIGISDASEKKRKKESKAKNKGVVLAERELMHARKKWRDLSPATKQHIKEAFNAMSASLKELPMELQGKKISNLLNKYAQMDPATFDTYWALKTNGTLFEKASLAFMPNRTISRRFADLRTNINDPVPDIPQ